MALTLLSTSMLPASARQMASLAGVILEEYALIEKIPVHGDAVRKRIEVLAQEEIATLFTSQMAVQVAMDLLQGYVPSAWSCYCTGNATRRALEGFLGGSSIKGIAPSARGLAEVVRKGLRRGQPIVFFCSDQRRWELPLLLYDSGIRIEELVLYHTRYLPICLPKHYQGILFCSPSAVRSFFAQNEAPRETVFFALGPSTADELSFFSPNAVVTCPEPDKYSLLHQAMLYFAQPVALTCKV